jgi:hypothetical protein
MDAISSGEAVSEVEGRAVLTEIVRMYSRFVAMPENLKRFVPRDLRQHLSVLYRRIVETRRGFRFAQDLRFEEAATEPSIVDSDLSNYFDTHDTGPGIVKWLHYFPIYERYFQKFRGRPVTIVEIGVYSGGSLRMWREYFGEQAEIFGVDILPACRAFEDERTHIYIGDQADPQFWRRFLQDVPTVDIIIDDGGHQLEQQVATLEALLPHLSPGGVYVCEDLESEFHPFHDYITGLSRGLHTPARRREGGHRQPPTAVQQAIDSIHIHPFVTVIERRADRLDRLRAPAKGSDWVSTSS